MKLEVEANIWTTPTDDLSGRDKGRIYAQRAHFLIGEALNDPVRYERLFRNGRVRRKIFADLVGCHRSALLDNPQIVDLLDKVEGTNRQEELGEPALVSNDSDDMPEIPTLVKSLMSRLKQECHIAGRHYDDRIVLTDTNCRIGEHRYEIPTIIWPDGIDTQASDWLRYLVMNAKPTSTARQYAKVLRAFLRHCRERARQWHHVDDEFLRSWRDGRRGQIDDLQVVSDLNIVFQFYVWAETTGELDLHVGIYEKEELPPGFKRFDFPITGKRKKSKGTANGWSSTLTFRAQKSIVGRRNTPTNDQVVSVHEQLMKADYGERNSLIAAWAELAGPRRFEILQLRVDHIPTYEKLAQLIDDEENAEISVGRRKRGSKAPLSANPYLLSMTREWIDGGRQKIIDECRKRIVGYRSPNEIFVSSTTGKVLHPDSVTKTMGAAFKAADVKKASLHRLRAKAIVDKIEEQLAAFRELNIVVEAGSELAETILVRVAETSGHASPLSLHPYLNFILSRRSSQTDAARAERRAAKTRYDELRAIAARAELEAIEEIRDAVRLSRNGKPKEAAKKLQEYVAKLLETASDVPH